MMTRIQSKRSSNKAGWKTQLLCIVLGYLLDVTTFSLIKTIGVFYIQLQTDFQASATEVSFTIGLQSAVLYFGGPLYGAILNAVGLKPTITLSGILMFIGLSSCFFATSLLYVQLLMGVITGVGAGLENAAVLTIMGRAFHTNRPIAIGALAMADSTATAAGGPAFQWCIDNYTWRGAFLLMGGICLNGVAIGCVMVPVYKNILKKRQQAVYTSRGVPNERDGPHKKSSPDGVKVDPKPEKALYRNDRSRSSKESENNEVVKQCYRSRDNSWPSAFWKNFRSLFDVTLLKNPWFICYCISCGFSMSSRIISVLYVVRYAQSLGMDGPIAATKLAVVESAAFVMTPVISLITSLKRKPREGSTVKYCLQRAATFVPRSYVLAGFQLLMSFVLYFSTFVENSNGFTVYAALLGLSVGPVNSMTNVVLADLFGTSKLPGALGYRSLSCGIILLGSTPLIGYIIDVKGTYKMAQYCTSAMAFLSGVLTIISQVAVHMEKTRDRNSR